MKLWQRHFLVETLKVFATLLLCFYLIFTLIDYSLHAKDLVRNSSVHFFPLVKYYLFQFFKRADILIPITLMISTIKVLLSLNARRELVALQAAGVPLRRLATPFLGLALACTLFVYISMEFIAPEALTYTESYEDGKMRAKRRKSEASPLFTLRLKDGTSLIYRDKTNEQLEDVVWVKSPNDLWRMKSLSNNPKKPIALQADHLLRGEDQKFYLAESHPEVLLEELNWKPSVLRKGLLPIEHLSISKLTKLISKKSFTTYKHPEVLSHLIYKLTLPLLPMLIICTLFGHLVSYRRDIPAFRIYAVSLFAFVAFYALLDGALLLGENGSLPPLLAIGAPLVLVALLALRTYQKKVLS